jgi:hypothetical protein
MLLRYPLVTSFFFISAFAIICLVQWIAASWILAQLKMYFILQLVKISIAYT